MDFYHAKTRDAHKSIKQSLSVKTYYFINAGIITSRENSTIEIGDQLIAPRPKTDQTDGADGNFSSHTLFLYCLRFKKKDFLEILFKNNINSKIC